MGRRDLEDRRVLQRGDAMDGSGPEAEARAGGDDLLVERLLARLAKLHARAAALDVPALVFLPVKLERERLARPHEEHLPYVRVGVSPDQLPAPGLLDPPRLEGEAVEGAVVRTVSLNPAVSAAGNRDAPP